MNDKDKKAVETDLRSRVVAVIKDAVTAGYVLQFEVGRPAARRQALTADSLYLRPLDGSDLYSCSCCGNPYEPKFRSRHLPNYVPINWCGVCRLELVEAGGRADRVLLAKAESRLAATLEVIAKSEARWRAVVRSWGSGYLKNLQRLRDEFDARLLELQQAEVDSGNSEVMVFRSRLAERVGR